MLKAYSVFNVAQLENLADAYTVDPQKLPDDVRLNDARYLVARSGIKVQWGRPQPAYYPGPDRVVMPNFDDFKSADDIVSTLGHELIHATSHPSRLARKFSPKVFKTDYTTEELLAELGSAFVCASLGYSSIEAQSPAYLEGWLKVLKADSRAIFPVASYASQASDWLIRGPRSRSRKNSPWLTTPYHTSETPQLMYAGASCLAV
jgi:antirestriction protein ArdC